jgi:hypothetical protein
MDFWAILSVLRQQKKHHMVPSQLAALPSTKGK